MPHAHVPHASHPGCPCRQSTPPQAPPTSPNPHRRHLHPCGRTMERGHEEGMSMSAHPSSRTHPICFAQSNACPPHPPVLSPTRPTHPPARSPANASPASCTPPACCSCRLSPICKRLAHMCPARQTLTHLARPAHLRTRPHSPVLPTDVSRLPTQVSRPPVHVSGHPLMLLVHSWTRAGPDSSIRPTHQLCPTRPPQCTMRRVT